MKSAKIVVLALALCLAVATAGWSDSAIKWTSLSEAQSRAKNSSKQVYFHFYTDWCGYCKKMDATTFKDPKVIKYLNDHFLSVKLNPEKGDDAKKLASQYRVRGFPAHGFSADGQTPLTAQPGYMAPEQFMMILEFLGSDSYKTMSFQDFSKKKK
ncbi:MAG: thioredoxin family protein [Desulfatibacillum sp.]|nr:thioredoxin family protein [Desulfatibacillum sp.]